MTDWGAHHFGGATFAIDVRELQPTEVVFHNEDGKQHLEYRYPNGVLLTPRWAITKSTPARINSFMLAQFTMTLTPAVRCSRHSDPV